ncbi:MAG: AraC family transcriptional regulator [Victivallales bacterium]|jgi:AraC-like DNA-binding protein
MKKILNIDFISERVSTEASKVAAQVDIKLLRFSYFRSPDWHLPVENRRVFHNHIYWEIDGDGELICKNKTYPLQGGNIYLLGQNCRVGLNCRSNVERYYAVFSCELLTGVDLLYFLDEPVCLGKWTPTDMKILNGIDRKKGISIEEVFFVKGLIFKSLPNLRPELGKAVDFHSRIYSKHKTILDHIDSNLSAGLKLSSLAKLVNMPNYELSRRFKNDTGFPLKNYVNRKIFSRANTMILENSLLIKEIAEKLGFRDEYYFNRFFFKMAGISPGKYRNQHM